MDRDATGKKIRQGVSLSPRTNDIAVAMAKARFGGNVSAYIRDLIERDDTGTVTTPSASDSKILEHLYTAILPSRTERFRRIWDARTRLGVTGPTQAEVVESLLRTYLQELEADPVAQLINAFDVLPSGKIKALVNAATAGDTAALERDPNILRYTQPEEPARHVAEDQLAPSRTLRTLPKKPPKPPSTGTTP